MDTETYSILLIDLERTLKRLEWIDVMDSHCSKLTKRTERLEVARANRDDLEDCKADLQTIYDQLRQVKINAA